LIALTSYWGLEAALREFKPDKLVSLMDPPCDLQVNGIKASAHLRVALHDIALRIPFATRPERVHVGRLLDFGATWVPPERLLVHCAAGISRSSAALILLLAQKNPGREDQVVMHVRDRAHHIMPNRRIIELGDHALGCRGRLIEAVSRMREPTLRHFGDRWVEFPTSLEHG
jgi:predicted protein tyrosine phosphatase